jgi:hypothetical protein
MRSRRGKPTASGLLIISYLALTGPGWCQPVVPCKILPLALSDGHCECVLACDHRDEKYLLIIGSLSRKPGPYPVIVQTSTTIGPLRVPIEKSATDPSWAQRTREWRERLVREQPSSALDDCYPASLEPARRREFFVFLDDGDFRNATGYASVTGELKAVGRRCQVYVDREDQGERHVQATADEIVRVLDCEVYPEACKRFGRVLDVDRDGRFTILLTHRLGQMSKGKVALSGFVRGGDFYRDVPAPFSNHCDMMYLNSNLTPGGHLRTVIAHEFTHAIIFSEHVFGGYLPELPRADEESWLNEGIAHLAEDSFDYSWSNLDYRVSTFLSAPECHQLIVPDYYTAGLWRSHGNRGAAYLFLRWCTDRYGPDLPGRLIHSGLAGVPNIETATQAPFAELFRQWTAALASSSMNMPLDGVAPFRRIHLSGPLGSRVLNGPRLHEMASPSANLRLDVAGTAAAYVLLHAAPTKRLQLSVSGPSEADLQLSIIRLAER